MRFSRSHLWPSVAVFLSLVLVVVYRGPGRAFIRGHVGDFLVVIFLYFLSGIVLRSRLCRFWAILILAFGLELRQWIFAGVSSQSFAAEMTIGATFDVIDLLAYVLGLLSALILEKRFLGASTPYDSYLDKG